MGRLCAAAVFLFSSAPLFSQTSPSAESAVRRSIYDALPEARRPASPDGDISGVIARIDAGSKGRAVAALQDRLRDFAGDPAGTAVIGGAFLDLGRADLAKRTAEDLYAQDESSPDANMLMGRVYQRQGKLAEALAFYKAVPAGDLAMLAKTKTKEVEGLLERAGRTAGEPSSRPGAEPVSGSHNGLSPADLSLVAAMFRSQGASPTLAHTLQKAAHGDAAGLAALRRAGIDFARGPEGQRDAVVLEKKGAVQVVSFSPEALDNPDKKRAIARLADGVEQAATQRDFSGVMLTLRQWGGRLVSVLVYLELAPGVKLTDNVPEADKRLVSDAIAHENTGETNFPTPPNHEAFYLMAARREAGKDDPARRLSVFLYFCGRTVRDSFVPATMKGDDVKYYNRLRSLDK